METLRRWVLHLLEAIRPVQCEACGGRVPACDTVDCGRSGLRCSVCHEAISRQVLAH